MNNEAFKYRQDTIEVKKPLENLPEIQEAGSLRIKRSAPVELDPIRTRDTVDQQQKTAEKAQSSQPTMAQIRYLRGLQEQKLLVGDSRYIESRDEINFGSTQDLRFRELVLPSYEMNRVNTDWLTFLLLFALVLFATIRNTWSKYLGHLFQSIVNYSTSNRIFWEKNDSVLHGAFRLNIFFYLVFSIFLFQIIYYYRINIPFTGYTLYFIILGGILVYFMAKKMFYKLIGILFENTGETSEFLFNMDNFNQVTGLVLFPVVSVIAFFPINNRMFPVNIGIGIVLLVYFLLLYRGFVILLRKQFSIIYLFLYFCILEILPLVLVYKILLIYVGIV